MRFVERLLQYADIKLQVAELTVDVKLTAVEIYILYVRHG